MDGCLARTITKIEANPLLVRGKSDFRIMRVAAHCRVSTDDEDQLNSYQAQIAYYTDAIAKRPNSTFAGIYADEGITGTSTKKRKDFLRLIMRKILDKMFENKKLSILIPIFISTLLYLLFIIFGVAEDKMNIIIATPIAAVFWFFGAFLVVYFQVKNKRCPEVFLNIFEFVATLFFGIYSIVDAISVVISGFQTFTPITVAGLLTYASIA